MTDRRHTSRETTRRGSYILTGVVRGREALESQVDLFLLVSDTRVLTVTSPPEPLVSCPYWFGPKYPSPGTSLGVFRRLGPLSPSRHSSPLGRPVPSAAVTLGTVGGSGLTGGSRATDLG